MIDDRLGIGGLERARAKGACKYIQARYSEGRGDAVAAAALLMMAYLYAKLSV